MQLKTLKQCRLYASINPTITGIKVCATILRDTVCLKVLRDSLLPCVAVVAPWLFQGGRLSVWQQTAGSPSSSATGGTPLTRHGNPPPTQKQVREGRSRHELIILVTVYERNIPTRAAIYATANIFFPTTVVYNTTNTHKTTVVMI